MVLYLLEINEHRLGRPSVCSVSNASRTPWRLLARCESNQADSCLLLQQIAMIGRANPQDAKSALSALAKLVQVSAVGQPLEVFYDKKQCHPIHDFIYKERRHVLWRIRKGDVRLVFYYAQDRVIFLADTFSKRKDKLTNGEKKQLEDEIKTYVDAEMAEQIVMVS